MADLGLAARHRSTDMSLDKGTSPQLEIRDCIKEFLKAVFSFI
jgi:hypothetical protein